MSRTREFKADCRWIAGQIGASVDDVNLALSRLLRLGLLQMNGEGNWKDTTGLRRLTPGEFRKVGLDRVRKESTARFYSNLFGWSINANNPMGYRRIATGSADGIQGGIWPAPQQSRDFVQLFIAVDDVRLSVRKAEELGAKLIIPPTMLPEGDEMAVLLDPHGMSFGVWKAKNLSPC